MVCDVVVSDTQVPHILVEPGISIFRIRRKEVLYPEEGGSRFLQIVWVYLPNLMESHPITLFSTNWKSTLHITCLGLIYMSTRVVELHIEFLERYAVSFSLHKTHGDVPLWTCSALRIYSCCVFRCHINRRIWVQIMLTSSKEMELFIHLSKLNECAVQPYIRYWTSSAIQVLYPATKYCNPSLTASHIHRINFKQQHSKFWMWLSFLWSFKFWDF